MQPVDLLLWAQTDPWFKPKSPNQKLVCLHYFVALDVQTELCTFSDTILGAQLLSKSSRGNIYHVYVAIVVGLHIFPINERK